MNAPNAPAQLAPKWRAVCTRQDLVANSGVVALVDGVQVAVFYLPDELDQSLFALENKDPKSDANVIGRGIVGQLAGNLVVASPMYKQHFRLRDGSCVQFPEQCLRTWPIRFNGDSVEIG